MKLKSPTEPVLLTDESAKWLKNLMKKNDNRTRLNKAERDLLAGSECYYEQLKSML